ncbi:uncharacterized protein AB9W97_016442 isoform 1-T3 [Spinachia spinachia]
MQFGRPGLSSLNYTTTAMDHYRKPSDYRSSTTNTDDLPVMAPRGTPCLLKQKASSVIFGDPLKIIERESTYAVSFRWTDEHKLTASNTKTYNGPLKTRVLCAPQHMSNIRFPLAHHLFSTTYREECTTKPLTS